MADSMNIDALFEEAKQYGIELTEEQLDGIAGGEQNAFEVLGFLFQSFADIGACFEAMREAKKAGMTVEQFIVTYGGQLTPETIDAVTYFWNLAG